MTKKKEIKEKVAPLGPVYQAGTLSGNPVAMAAGCAALEELESQPPYENLAKTTRDLSEAIMAAAQKKNVAVQVNHACGMFTVFFYDGPVNSYFDALLADTKKYALFFQELLKRGIFFPPSQYEAAFISTAHTEEVMARAKSAIAEALEVVSR